MTRRDIIDYYNSLNIIGYERATQDDIVRVYTEIQTERRDMSNIDEWKHRLETILSDKAARQFRETDIPGPFIQQFHSYLPTLASIVDSSTGCRDFTVHRRCNHPLESGSSRGGRPQDSVNQRDHAEMYSRDRDTRK